MDFMLPIASILQYGHGWQQGLLGNRVGTWQVEPLHNNAAFLLLTLVEPGNNSSDYLSM
jgi:hypothetical protein